MLAGGGWGAGVGAGAGGGGCWVLSLFDEQADRADPAMVIAQIKCIIFPFAYFFIIGF